MTSEAVNRTQCWLSEWVIDLNLCPFAKYPFQNNQVKIFSTKETNADEIYRFVLSELDALYQSSVEEVETVLLVVENALDDFEDYLDFLMLLEDVIDQIGLRGIIQVASFHPRYCFDGCAENDAANYTNRSPYPMFHLLREESLEKALANYENPEKIPERNIALLQEMGVELIKQKLSKI